MYNIIFILVAITIYISAPLIPYQQQQQTNYDEYHDHVRRDYYINRASTATTTGDTAAAPETNSSSGTVHERVLFHVMMLLVRT